METHMNFEDLGMNLKTPWEVIDEIGKYHQKDVYVLIGPDGSVYGVEVCEE